MQHSHRFSSIHMNKSYLFIFILTVDCVYPASNPIVSIPTFILYYIDIGSDAARRDKSTTAIERLFMATLMVGIKANARQNSSKSKCKHTHSSAKQSNEHKIDYERDDSAIRIEVLTHAHTHPFTHLFSLYLSFIIIISIRVPCRAVPGI